MRKDLDNIFLFKVECIFLSVFFLQNMVFAFVLPYLKFKGEGWEGSVFFLMSVNPMTRLKTTNKSVSLN